MQQDTWASYLVRGEAPRWVPTRVGKAFAAAHAKDTIYGAAPDALRIPNEESVLLESESKFTGKIPGDLALCFSDLFELAVGHSAFMRHIFQQIALLWRTYREARRLPVRSSFEAELVQLIVAPLILQIDSGPALGNKMKQLAVEGKLPTVHDLIDQVFFGIRASQRRR